MAEQEYEPSDDNQEVMVFGEALSRVFPLTADTGRLQQLVDEALNVQDHYHFRVTTPFVYMQLISYGEMKDHSGSPYHTSQRELLFMVPVEWYELAEEDDKEAVYRFNGKPYKPGPYPKGSVTPFIFVDNELSVVQGREQFGWPKGLMTVARADTGWVDVVRARNQLVAIDVRSLERYGEDERPEENQLLEICRSPGVTVSLSERMLLNQLDARLEEAKHIIDTEMVIGSYLMGVWKDLLGLAGGSHPVSSGPKRIADYLGNMIDDLHGYMGNSIGLKRFLDNQHQSEAAYLSIACSHAEITDILECGLLGSLESILTTISGGYTIRISELASHPIVERLGLDVVTEETGDDGEPRTHLLMPVFPFWLKVNVKYWGDVKPIYEEVQGQDVTGTVDTRPDFVRNIETPEKTP